MPGLGNTTITLANLFLGPANIWVDVTAPTTGTRLTLTSGTPSSGVNIGATGGPVEFSYRPTNTEIRTEQTLAPVDFAVSDEEATLAFDVAEFVGVNIAKFFQGATSVGTGATQWIYNGGNLTVSSRSIVMIHQHRESNSKYAYIMLYKAYIAEPVTVTFSRTAQTMYRVRMKALADASRVVGDHLFQIVPDNT